MAVGASRGSLLLAFATIVAACQRWQVTLAFSTGDVLIVNGPQYDSSTHITPTLTLAGYSPSGVYRGSIDLSSIGGNGTATSNVYSLTLSPDGRYAFLQADYIYTSSENTDAKQTSRLVVADIQSAKAEIVAVLSMPFPDNCRNWSSSTGDGLVFVPAPGRAPGTYTLYTNPICANLEPNSRIAVVAFVYDVQHRTLKFQRELLYRGGTLKNSPFGTDQSQQYDPLFVAGTTLYALLTNVSDNNPRSLLHLDSQTGAVLSRYVAYSEQKQGCIYPLLNSPSSLYALCDVYHGAAPDAAFTWQIKLFAKFKAAEVVTPTTIVTPSKDVHTYDIKAMATLGEDSRYITIATTTIPADPLPPPQHTSVTITKLSKTTGEVVHSFTKPFIGYAVNGFAIVPPQQQL